MGPNLKLIDNKLEIFQRWVSQVIQAGSWGGIYFNPRGGRAGIHGPSVDVTHEEFPADWFEGLPVDAYRGKRYNKRRNKYGVWC